MSLKSLSCLVLAVVLGTAVSVRWYLDAEEAVHAAPRGVAAPVVYQHLPLPVRAEAARPFGKRGPPPAPAGIQVDLSVPSPAVAPLVRRPEAQESATSLEPAASAPGSASF
jgi:hypothetical protein